VVSKLLLATSRQLNALLQGKTHRLDLKQLHRYLYHPYPRHPEMKLRAALWQSLAAAYATTASPFCEFDYKNPVHLNLSFAHMRRIPDKR
jgi:hypothetical protein